MLFRPAQLSSGIDIKAVVTHGDAIRVIEESYADYGSFQSVLSSPPAMTIHSINADTANFKVKRAHSGSCGVSGFRVLIKQSAGRGELVSYCCLVGSSSGRLLGVVEETWLHRLQTAVTGVVAAKLLAREDSRVVTIVGTGRIANEVPPALASAFDLDEIRIVSRRYETAQAFARKHEGIAPMRAIRTIDDAVNGSDIVIAVSSAKEPLIHKRHLSPGLTVCALGGGAELAVDTLELASKLIVNDLKYACMAGSVAGWSKDGMAYEAIQRRGTANIGQVAKEPRAGRNGPDEIVLSVIQGMASCNIALANYALQLRSAAGEPAALTCRA